MKLKKKPLTNFAITLLILFFSFLTSLIVHSIFHKNSLVASIFVLAVFLVSLITDGYFWGITSALISVLAVNIAFTFPYFKLNFAVSENLVSVIIMLIITILTSALTTKIKNQEKIKSRAEKETMRANLLRAISHDLRTPLTSIYGASSTVIENYDSLSDTNKREMITAIKEDSQWLIKIVENLLYITKIDNSSVKLIKTPVVLEELVDSVIEKFRKSYSNQNVELILPDEFIMVSADALLIEQVLLNLLENAVQHAKGMKNLTFKITVFEKKATFRIIDDGCGIAKEKLQNIFSGIYSNDNVPADSQKRSMGIGLSVCNTIIKAHESEIFAERNSNHKGMSFWFSLDIEEIDDE